MSDSTRNIDDKSLFHLIQKGRKDAFEKLFRRYYHSLWRHSYKFTKNTDVSEDITQDFFIHLWEKADTVSIGGSIEAYFYVSIKNRSLSYLRKKINLNVPIEENVDLDYEDVDHLVFEELSTNIQKAIDQLPEKCRTIFLLSRESLFSYKEIAQHLNISIKTVETQMGIALKKLREQLILKGLAFIVVIKILNIFFTLL